MQAFKCEDCGKYIDGAPAFRIYVQLQVTGFEADRYIGSGITESDTKGSFMKEICRQCAESRVPVKGIRWNWISSPLRAVSWLEAFWAKSKAEVGLVGFDPDTVRTARIES